MDDNLPYYLGFSYCEGIGPTKLNVLLRAFGSVKDAYLAPESQLKKYIGAKLARRLVVFRKGFDAQCELAYIKKCHITVLTRESDNYPVQLTHLFDPPLCLYIKGDLSGYSWDKDIFIAIVGTRKPSEYGKQVTIQFSRELALAGCVIVSGMALGIDGIAHWGALNTGKRTIAVLGSGVNFKYPPAHSALYDRIIASGGLVISEFPSRMFTKKGMFVSRNRIISGLSRGIIVTEGLKDSGALITARCALEQGKDVFAPPAPITSRESQAPNLLLKEGATLVTSPKDVLEEYGVAQKHALEQVIKKLNSQEQKLAELLASQAFTPDELARTIKAPIHEVLTLLSTMELAGIVEKNSIGKYQIRV